jgi:hypothetical protein
LRRGTKDEENRKIHNRLLRDRAGIVGLSRVREREKERNDVNRGAERAAGEDF